MNKALKYEPFLDVFIQLMTKKPYKDFKKTFLGHKFSFRGDCDHLINSQEKNEEAAYTYYDETFKRELLTDKREGEIEDKNLSYIIHNFDRIVSKSCADVNLADFDYEFPIYVASENRYYEIVKYLVQNGADVNKSIPNMYMISGCVPSLYIAAIQVYSGIVNCLVQNGADVDITGFCNMTPLFQASSGGFIVKILVESRADVNFCDNNNRSPLFVASEEGHSDIISYLIHNGGDVNMCDDYGTSPLLASIENGHLNVLQTLLNNNAQVNIQLSGKRLPFMFALMKGRVEIANFLLQNGADYKMKN
ncbi:unnamed protein product [Mytilus coruscus]|uniref:Uncharacterized protein n=1 Tax=Mytilus coruscus TaxID=42192 RepID=A0A6J8BJH0_MYTCO|nr:unnamed protein product [Mytilus coruscus]